MRCTSTFIGVAVAVLCTVSVAVVNSTEGTGEFKAASVDSLIAAYPLGSGTSSKSMEIGRLSQSSVHFLETRTGMKPHFHRHSDEVLYVLSGRGVLTIGPEAILVGADGAEKKGKNTWAGGRSVPVRAGSVVLIPHGTAHQLEVTARDAPFVAFSIFSPAQVDDDRVYLSE